MHGRRSWSGRRERTPSVSLIEDTIEQMRRGDIGTVAKPKAASVGLAQPLALVTVEAIRAQLGRFDQIVIDLMPTRAWPGEATSARWEVLGDRVIRVDASKTSRERAVRLLAG